MGRNIPVRKVGATKTIEFRGRHRFEHWSRDNTAYFITSRTRNGFQAFKTPTQFAIFWDRLLSYSKKYNFEIWIVTLMSNHYHVIGYLKNGANLGPMMRQLHGSISKLVNDTLKSRHLPFWREAGHRDYFDGCLRDEDQLRKAFKYVRDQAVKARLVSDWSKYPHTRIEVEIEECVKRANERDVWLINVPYKRYQKRQ